MKTTTKRIAIVLAWVMLLTLYPALPGSFPSPDALASSTTLKPVFPIGMYNVVQYLGDGFFRVRKGSQYGIADKDNNMILPLGSYDYTEYAGDDYFEVRKGTQRGIADKNNNMTFPLGTYDFVYYQGDGFFRVRKGSLYGVVDKDNNMIFTLGSYTSIDYVGDGFFKVQSGTLWGVVGEDKNVLIPFGIYDIITYQGDGYFVVRKGTQYGVATKDNNMVFPLGIYDYIEYWGDDYFAVDKISAGSSLAGLVDKDNKIIFPLGMYAYVYYAGDGYFIIDKDNDKTGDTDLGVTDKDNNVILPFGMYDWVYYQGDGYFKAGHTDKVFTEGIVDKDNNVIFPFGNYEVEYHGDGYFISNFEDWDWNAYRIDSLPINIPSINDPLNASIDLANETITLPFTAGAYSVNGGIKWKDKPLTPELFKKLLDKGMNLYVAEGYSKATKTYTGKCVHFPTINPRPKANPEKLKADADGNLIPKTGDNITGTYQWALTSDNKNPSGDWSALSGALAVNSTNTVYLLRSPALSSPASTTAPASYTPASKSFKVTVKAPK
ncbi:MAG: WG repeat-containing protein [Oscillospiraceae bacterium]|nr:WG repeat-containing protein [Oscillospiraceae bacterium]